MSSRERLTCHEGSLSPVVLGAPALASPLVLRSGGLANVEIKKPNKRYIYIQVRL